MDVVNDVAERWGKSFYLYTDCLFTFPLQDSETLSGLYQGGQKRGITQGVAHSRRMSRSDKHGQRTKTTLNSLRRQVAFWLINWQFRSDLCKFMLFLILWWPSHNPSHEMDINTQNWSLIHLIRWRSTVIGGKFDWNRAIILSNRGLDLLRIWLHAPTPP